MGNWLFLNYVAKLEAEERERQFRKKPVKRATLNRNWLKSFIRNITGLFL
jgi:hypothetical protein